MTAYSYTLTDAELDRYRAMAQAALEKERPLWDQAGIGPGASVLDMGCGPGTFLLTLADVRRVLDQMEAAALRSA